MRALRKAPIPALVPCFVVSILAACDDDPMPPDDATLVGTWLATSFSALGTDFIVLGMALTVTFGDTGTYTLEVGNDLVGVCGEDETGGDCTTTGTYTSTASEITLDPGEEDEVTFDYSISGSTMTWSGEIEETPVTAMFTAQ